MRHFGHVVSVLPLDEQFYRDDHLFVHLRHEVVMLDGESICLDSHEVPTVGAIAGAPRKSCTRSDSRDGAPA
jgi:hypothetical protein